MAPKVPHPLDTRCVRKALIVGIKYGQTLRKLNGTYADVDRVYNLLVDVLQYNPGDIKVMKDDGGDPGTQPTRDNMLKAIDSLVQGAKDGDHFLFHFSGHGSQQSEAKLNSEKDNLDEAIWPSDTFWKDGIPSNIILDNEIHERLVKPLPERAHLVVIFDCCHSGTAADLEHCHTDHYTGEDMNFANITYRRTAFGKYDGSSQLPSSAEILRSPATAITPGGHGPLTHKVKTVSWAACRDSQVAYSDPEQGGLFIDSFANTIRELLKHYSGHPDEITHEKILHLVTLNLDYQTACARFSVHGDMKANGKKVPSYAELAKKWAAPRPQFGTSGDYNSMLRSSALTMFGYPL